MVRSDGYDSWFSYSCITEKNNNAYKKYFEKCIIVLAGESGKKTVQNNQNIAENIKKEISYASTKMGIPFSIQISNSSVSAYNEGTCVFSIKELERDVFEKISHLQIPWIMERSRYKNKVLEIARKTYSYRNCCSI